MFYILNKRKQIVAADDKLLALCGVSHIDELSVQIALGNTVFTPLSEEKSMHLVSNDIDEVFTMSETSLSSMLGHLTLVKIKTDKKKEDVKALAPLIIDNNEETSSEEIDSLLNTDNEIPKNDLLLEVENESDEISNENINLLLDTENDTIESEPLSPEDDSISLDSETEDEPSAVDITLADHLPVEYGELIDAEDNTPESADNNEETKENIPELTDNNEAEEISEARIDIEDDKFDLEELDLFGENETKDLENDEEETSEAEEIDLFAEDETKDLENDEEETPKAEEIDLLTENDTDNNILDEEEITLDAEEISENIGISVADYNNFLNEYIDTALNLEKDLQAEDTEKRNNAIKTLSNLSDVLHIPVLGDILDKVEHTSSDTQRPIIESFYSALSRITISGKTKTDSDKTEVVDEPQVQEDVTPTKKENPNGFGTISLEGIKPIHFDFLLDEAATDLSLPVELIEEFVHDFIEQAHVETKKMLKAYEEGNLDAIQKIGHLLKGASSNLRINTLSDTLYRIQFCEDTSQLEALIKDYWAHFLSFETKINAISK